jgi:hypothetical protein
VIKAQKAAGVDTLIPPGFLTTASMPAHVGPGPSKRGRKNLAAAHQGAEREGEMDATEGADVDGDMVDLDGEADDEDADGDMA